MANMDSTTHHGLELETRRLTGRDQMQIEHIPDGDNRRRMVVDGVTLGWITKWYKSDSVNRTGIKMFSAKPIGLSVMKHDCETYKSAEAYILGYHSEVVK